MLTCRHDGETRFRHAYSGRGMYGKTCFGIVTDEPMEVLVRLAHTVGLNQGRAESDTDNGHDDRAADVDAWESLGRALENVRTDNMGLSTILYWPGIPGDAVKPELDSDGTFTEDDQGNWVRVD